ncbi:MAG TPA: hypothetical protein VFS97_00245 [Nitrososphaeraceae archaeon]|nr:hypothetical protein [Nitrososphaeraceae archaeon]
MMQIPFQVTNILEKVSGGGIAINPWSSNEDKCCNICLPSTAKDFGTTNI